MIQLIPLGDEIVKFDDQTAQTWILKEDDDEHPIWVEIFDEEVVETDKEK